MTHPNTDITFRVHGTPSPQAGMRQVRTNNGAIRMITTGGTGLTEWRSLIANAAYQQAALYGCQDGPVHVRCQFRFRMPGSRPARAKADGWLWKITTPDTDKLQRAVGDGLVAGGLLRDDSLIVSWLAEKLEIHDDWLGALITVRPLTGRGVL